MNAAARIGYVEVDIGEAQRNLPDCLRRVADGQAIVIITSPYDGKPLAELCRVDARDFPPHPSGLRQGEFSVPHDFDAPLPADVLSEFVGYAKI